MVAEAIFPGYANICLYSLYKNGNSKSVASLAAASVNRVESEEVIAGFLQIRGRSRHPCLWLMIRIATLIQDLHQSHAWRTQKSPSRRIGKGYFLVMMIYLLFDL